MTKTVRIENACLNRNAKIRITVQSRNAQGDWEDTKESTNYLYNAANLLETTIWDGKRLIIDEMPNEIWSC